MGSSASTVRAEKEKSAREAADREHRLAQAHVEKIQRASSEANEEYQRQIDNMMREQRRLNQEQSRLQAARHESDLAHQQELLAAQELSSNQQRKQQEKIHKMEMEQQKKLLEAQRLASQKQEELQKQMHELELENQRKEFEREQEMARLQAEAQRREMELLAIEDVEETKNSVETTVNVKFEGEFGATKLDMDKAPECFQNCEDQQKIMSILSEGRVKTNPLSDCPENEELVQRVADETQWETENCMQVLGWALDPNSRVAVYADDQAIEQLKSITDIAVLNYKSLEDKKEIIKTIEILFGDLKGAQKEQIMGIAMKCMDTVLACKNLDSVERSKTFMDVFKVDVPAKDGSGRMETMSIRMRTALGFKYLVTTTPNLEEDAAGEVDFVPQIMDGDEETNEFEWDDETVKKVPELVRHYDEIEAGETNDGMVKKVAVQKADPANEVAVANKADDCRVVVAFRTTVHQMKTVEGSMNQRQSQLVAETNLF